MKKKELSPSFRRLFALLWASGMCVCVHNSICLYKYMCVYTHLYIFLCLLYPLVVQLLSESEVKFVSVQVNKTIHMR